MGKPNDDMSTLNTFLSFLLTKFNYFWSAQLMITTRCSSGCRFCIYANVKKEDMKKDLIDKGLDLFKELKIPRILITGGEPFESYDNLLYSFNRSKEFIPVSKIFVITSSTWARNEELVEKKFDPLIKLGLENLLMSIDAFHMENVSQEKYLLIFEYLKKTNVTPVILVRYNRDIKRYYDFFKKIKNEYDVRFAVDVIVKTGGAANLSNEEIKAEISEMNKFREEFERIDSKMHFFVRNPLKSVFTGLIRTTCVYPSLFPNGDLHLCCRKLDNTKICNLNCDDFYVSFEKFNKNFSKNLKNIISKPITCNNCPISL